MPVSVRTSSHTRLIVLLDDLDNNRIIWLNRRHIDTALNFCYNSKS